MTICDCVAYHSPVCRSAHRHHVWPLGMGGPDEPANIVRICPNQHAMTHRLIRLWGYRYDGEPPWWLRRHFSPLARALAEQGWTAWDLAGRPVDAGKWLWQGERVAVDVQQLARLRRTEDGL